MAVTVKKVKMWRKEARNEPGVLAETLRPLAEVGTDLQSVMGYRYPGDRSQAAIELFPISGRKETSAAQEAGLKEAGIPTLYIEGDNRPGLGYTISKAIGDAGINMIFLVAQVIGRRYSAIFGFESDADARKASNLIKKATSRAPAKKKAAAKKKTAKKKTKKAVKKTRG